MWSSVTKFSTVALIKFASGNLLTKVHLKKKSGGRKTRRWGIWYQIPYSLPSFFWLRFFFGVNFCGQNPGTYLHHTVSVVRLPDTVILIFPSTCNDTLEHMLPEEVYWQKFNWRKIRRSKNSTVIDRESNFLSILVEFYSIAEFFRGELFKIQTFWCLAGVRFLFYLNFIWKYLHVQLQKKHT